MKNKNKYKGRSHSDYFDILAFADYSGSKEDAAQKRHIYLATAKAGHDNIKLTGGYTRLALQKIIEDILSGASKNNKRVLFGFDHNYAFPDGFIQTISGSDSRPWRHFMEMVNKDHEPFSWIGTNPRKWATLINSFLSKKYNISSGPFWGPHFEPTKKPIKVFDKLPFSEKRVVENFIPRMKSVFQLGGAGSVGLQSLYGMYHLSSILSFCAAKGIPLHAWPYDGLRVTERKHVLIEIYPGFYNKDKKSDRNDAYHTVNYFLKWQNQGRIIDLFSLPDENSENEKIKREGWIPGI